MEAPEKGLSLEQFVEAVERHCMERYEVADGKVVCKTCKTPVRAVRSYASLHLAGFRICGGPGDVTNPLLPFCPTCEGKPKNLMTCVHVGRESFGADEQTLQDYVPGANLRETAVSGSPPPA